MKNITLFTLIYIALGVCFTIIALQEPGMIPRLKTHLLLISFFTYLLAVLSTFSSWNQRIQRIQRRLSNQPIWKQNVLRLSFLVPPIFFFVQFIISLLSHSCSAETVLNFCIFLFVLLPCIETLSFRSQARQ